MDFSQIQTSIENAVANLREYTIENSQTAVQDIENLQGTVGDAQEQLGNFMNELEARKQLLLQPQMQTISKKNIGKIKMGNKPVKSFNLKKAQEMQSPGGDMMVNDEPEMTGDKIETRTEVFNENPKFQDGGDLKDWLDRQDFLSARNQLFSYIGSPELQQRIEDALNAYYETSMDNNEKLQVSTVIFEMLPSTLKQLDINEEGVVMAPYTKAMIEEINETIKKVAKNIVKNKKKDVKAYNLNKVAQQKAFDTSVLMYGPGQVRLDPFYRQPASNYGIVERNKGFGLTVDDIWDIDYEAIWRGAIMDKYSRPYRDKDGNWVGGYINKRFEVDQWVPETNNYQLKPGEKRKPRLPQYGLIEGRLENAREKGQIKGSSIKESFNLKLAKKRDKIKKKV